MLTSKFPSNSYSIFASSFDGCIGNKNALPWKLNEDLKFFEKITTNYGREDNKNCVVLGRKTYESINKSLKNRDIIVLTSKKFNNVKTESKIENLLLSKSTKFFAGGAKLYDEVHRKKLPNLVFWTRVLSNKKGDVYVDLKSLHKNYQYLGVSKTRKANNISYDFTVLINKNLKEEVAKKEIEKLKIVFEELNNTNNSSSFPRTKFENSLDSQKYVKFKDHEEYQYLEYCDEIIKNGITTNNRTNISTIMKTGAVMRFDISSSFPLLTTKKVYWQGVVEELLWFIKGCTDSKVLANKGVHIWDANGTVDFMEKQGITGRREGDLGPIYGFQWRHFGADYKTCDDDYTGKGVDQLSELIEMIKKTPDSRRLIVSAWNPLALKKMALPPCHVLYQFIVDSITKSISCILYQRSGDWGLGIPFNIASYSLLCYIIAALTGYKPKEFIHFVANAHVYSNHKENIQEQLKRVPYPFPQVTIKNINNIDELTSDHIVLHNYKTHKNIKLDMAV